ncbi:MAG: DedA family protein [Chloroflexi bacterium]|nr:DedA family protein [Chloroflexota bacterium]
MPLDQIGSWLHWLYLLVRQNDEKALFLLLFVEEAGVPLPMPGDVVIMLAGYRASQDLIGVLEAAMSVTLGVQLGSTLLYLLSRRFGHAILFRYGKYIHLDEAKLRKVERWIHERGPIMVLVGRLTPGLRTPTSIISGVFEIPFHQFLFFTTLSALIWSGFWLALGYFGGTKLLPLVRHLHSPIIYVGIALVLIAALIAVRQRRRKQHLGSIGVSEIARASGPNRQG